MIELRQLRHIQFLAKYKNFGKAAEAANITQPALSISIKKAEKYFGNFLFSRRSKLIELTTQGEIALSIANSMLSALEKGKVDIINMNNLDKGIVKFGIDTYISKSVIPPVITDVNSKYPKISFAIDVNPWFNLIEPLRKGDLEFFITIYSSKDDFKDLDLVTQEINLPSPYYYVRKGHPLTTKDKIEGADIKKYPWVGNLASPTYSKWLLEVTESNIDDSYSNFLARLNDSEMGTEIILRSDAIGAVPYKDIEVYEEKGLIEALKIDWAIPHPKNIGVIVSLADKELSPATKLLIKEIKRFTNENY